MVTMVSFRFAAKRAFDWIKSSISLLYARNAIRARGGFVSVFMLMIDRIGDAFQSFTD